MLLKVTRKISLDCNARYNSIHGIDSYCSLFLLLFTVSTITITVTVTVSSQYPNNLNIDQLTELNNNVKDNLHWGWEN